MADAFPLLRRMHLFISMTDDELRELGSHFEWVEFKPEEVVFKQGDPGDAFFAIQEGQVEITRATLTGGSKLVSKLVAGDYFGEISLQHRSHRTASVKALTALKLWRLSRDDYYRSIFNNPKIKPHLEVALRSRNFARDADFAKLLQNDKTKEKSDEIVYLATLQHSIFLWQMLAPTFVGMLLVIALGAGLFYARTLIPPDFLPWAWGAAVFLFLLDLAWMRWNWIDFHNDWYIVTNKRIIDIDQVVFLFDSRAEVPLTSVSNTAIKASEWGRLFDYGDLIVNTFSGPIIFNNVPYPQATADMILEHLNRSRIQQKMQERETLKTTIRKSLAPPQQAGLSKAPPPPPPKQASFLPKPLQEFKGLRQKLTLAIREQQGDAIIYHKHHYVLIQRIGLQLLGVLGVIFVLFLYTFRIFTFDPVITLAVSLTVFIIFVGSALYQFLDWRNDIYMVTSTQIIDLERKPFGDESRKAANLESVMNVTYTKPSLLANFLNYGTVTVQTGPGGEMKFFNVFNPLSVQQDIYRRKETRAAAVANAASKQRQEELGQYFSAFYEMLEEDRRKRSQEGKQ
ncbi:MAG: cyclic nucleotide-binding domain-containing protein [Chloroflexi bacterium]|nr:cyclic nucleotide-binding domain-containing protein [Chloroflexota bacterium]